MDPSRTHQSLSSLAPFPAWGVPQDDVTRGASSRLAWLLVGLSNTSSKPKEFGAPNKPVGAEMKRAWLVMAMILGVLRSRKKRALVLKGLRLTMESVRTGVAPRIGYAQDGEDFSISHFLPETGFFVDVGAHHPERFSVTKLLYDKGWRGINIDATSAINREFKERRPRDINVYGLVGKSGSVTFFRFAEPALNTTNDDIAQERIARGRRLISTEKFTVVALEDILRSAAAPQNIDFLNVDAEGQDLQVLESLDWDNWHIGAVMVETHKQAWNVSESPLVPFLESKGFVPTLVFARSTFFVRR